MKNILLYTRRIFIFITEEIRSSRGNSSSTESIGYLEKLAELKDKGIITQEEFEQKKKQILGL